MELSRCGIKAAARTRREEQLRRSGIFHCAQAVAEFLFYGTQRSTGGVG